MKNTEQQKASFKVKPYQHAKRYETPTGKSLTVPDDTYTVAELLERHARGLPLAGRPGAYVDDSDIEDDDLEKFGRLDVTDRFEIAQKAAEIVREEHTHQESKKEKAKQKERTEFEDWKKEKLSKPPENQEDGKKPATK